MILVDCIFFASCRYGIRGNVCLKRTDGAVAWISNSKTGAITWLPQDEACEVISEIFSLINFYL